MGGRFLSPRRTCCPVQTPLENNYVLGILQFSNMSSTKLITTIDFFSIKFMTLFFLFTVFAKEIYTRSEASMLLSADSTICKLIFFLWSLGL